MPFAGQDPPAALFRYSPNRSGAHPVQHLRGFEGLLQADAYAEFNPLYAPGRVPGPVTASFCWSHGRRKLYELADIAAGKRRGKGVAPISPVALEAVKRIDALFEIEREINGESAERRLVVRAVGGRAQGVDARRAHRAVAPRPGGEDDGLHAQARDGFARFPDDPRICLTNNDAERALRPLARGRRLWLFAGSERAAAMYTLIGTAKLNDVDPQACFADVLGRIAALPHTRVQELLPWNWKAARDQTPAA